MKTEEQITLLVNSDFMDKIEASDPILPLCMSFISINNHSFIFSSMKFDMSINETPIEFLFLYIFKSIFKHYSL